MTAGADAQRRALVTLLVQAGVLRFGEFTLKSGRISPYFFNLGALNTGAAIQRLGEAYADVIEAADLHFEVVFGPAYKGIPIAVATAEALARRGRDRAWAFNRKEPKDHGEGGAFVGADPGQRVVLVDDVLTAGTAIREAVGLVRAAGGTLVGVVIAMDRQELDGSGRTAVQSLAEELAIPVLSLLALEDVIEYLDREAHSDNHHAVLSRRIREYRQVYCAPDGARNQLSDGHSDGT
ncbi:MAG: orotate phosphoribosyltransferase [Pseudomonadales bacterium]